MSSRTLLRLTKAKTYYSYHGMQGRDAENALRQYKDKIPWKSGHKVLDVGCGPGDLTVNCLLPLVPHNGQVIGTDISLAMIQYASSNYVDPRLSFEVMDIADPKQGERYNQYFDTIFSFYCLHWVQDQRRTMKNITNMLQDGGDVLFVFLASSPIYTMYERLASNPKWSPYMQDFKEAVSPYHYSHNPEYDVRRIMEKTGLLVIDCVCTKTSYSVPSEDVLYKSVHAVNPFTNRIPVHLLEEYEKACKKEVEEANLINICKETKKISFVYSLMTVYATKPLKRYHLLKCNANRME